MILDSGLIIPEESFLYDIVTKNFWGTNYYNSLDYGKIIGIGAVICNGYSYNRLSGCLTYLTDCSGLDGFNDNMMSLIYIKNYIEPDYGYYGKNYSGIERTICDFIMYPDELMASVYMWDALEGYIEDDETPDNLTKVYDMLSHFRIDRSKLDYYLDEIAFTY